MWVIQAQLKAEATNTTTIITTPIPHDTQGWQSKIVGPQSTEYDKV